MAIECCHKLHIDLIVKKPNLLFIISDLGPGGAQLMNIWLVKELKKRGHDVQLIALFKRPWHEPLANSNLDIARLDAHGFGKFFFIPKLFSIVKRSDIVIAGEDLAATNYGFFVSKFANKPFIAWTHIAFHEHIKILGKLDRWLTDFVRRRVRRMIFPSQGALESMSQYLGKHDDSWKVIENFLPSSTQSSSAPPHPDWFSKPVLLGIGRLAEQKAFDRLVRIHAGMRASGISQHLVILGDGPDRLALEQEIARLGVSDTVFLPGHVNNVADWLAHATVFALCSRYEGFALVLLEALAAGVPTVAMDCPAGPREILRDGEAGVLVPEGDEIAMQAAIAELLAEPALRGRYAQAGLTRARDFTPEYIVPKWEALLQDVWKQQHG